jgi:hypothetical protein
MYKISSFEILKPRGELRVSLVVPAVPFDNPAAVVAFSAQTAVDDTLTYTIIKWNLL